MQYASLYVNERLLIPRLGLADSWLTRMQGLLGRPALEPNEGLLLKPCNSVHTVGMTYPLDIAFLAKNGEIIKLVTAIKPWRIAICLRAYACLELSAGSIAQHGLAIRQRLRIVSGHVLIASPAPVDSHSEPKTDIPEIATKYSSFFTYMRRSIPAIAGILTLSACATTANSPSGGSNNALDTMRKAETAYANQDWKGAEKHYQEVIKEIPKNAYA